MIHDWLPEYQKRVEDAIHTLFIERYTARTVLEGEFESAMRYAVEGGGKRVRPILGILAYEYLMKKQGKEEGSIDHIVIGLELIHCYTLVHDDLPCLDNDEYRRGKLTVWKAYSEPMALLVGDALQTLGFECLATSGSAELVREVAHALGDMGVVRGQVRDSLCYQTDLTLDELMRLHDEKTGVFIVVSLIIGVLLAGGDDTELARFESIGKILGRAFQYKDDILDALGTLESTGKATGKDISLGKGIVAKLGLEQAKRDLESMKIQVLELMADIDDEKLHDMVEYIFDREK